MICIASATEHIAPTVIAANLALAWMSAPPQPGAPRPRLTLADAAVAFPQAARLLKPLASSSQEVHIVIPEIDAERCTRCGRCAELCVYGAIAVADGRVAVFAELCVGCGRCARGCPERAIREVPRLAGRVERGRVGSMTLLQGLSEPGVFDAAPVQRAVARAASQRPGDITILIAPTGVGRCAAEALRRADYALLAVEPSARGLRGLRALAGLARDTLSRRVGVAMVGAGAHNADMETFCREHNLPILLRFDDAETLRAAWTQDAPLAADRPELGAAFAALAERLAEEAAR